MADESRTPNAPESMPEPKPTAGQTFVKNIRPAGCALFLILAILVTAVCLTSGRDPVPGYEAPQTMNFYAENPEALVAELETGIFPALEYDMTAAVTGGTVTVTIEDESFVIGRAAILRYFDESLFTFERGE